MSAPRFIKHEGHVYELVEPKDRLKTTLIQAEEESSRGDDQKLRQLLGPLKSTLNVYPGFKEHVQSLVGDLSAVSLELTELASTVANSLDANKATIRQLESLATILQEASASDPVEALLQLVSSENVIPESLPTVLGEAAKLLSGMSQLTGSLLQDYASAREDAKATIASAVQTYNAAKSEAPAAPAKEPEPQQESTWSSDVTMPGAYYEGT